MGTRKPSAKLTYKADKDAYYKWHPGLQKTVHVATGVTELEALAIWRRMLEHDAKPVQPPRGGTLAALCVRYVQERRRDADAGKISPDHYSGIVRVLGKLGAFFGSELQLSEMTPDDWTRYARHLERLAPVSRRHARAIILAMFRQADDDGWIQTLPRMGRAFRELAKTKGAGRVQPFTRGQCLQILARVEQLARDGKRMTDPRSFQNLRAAFYLGLNGGLTPADLTHLQVSEIDLGAGWIRHTRHKIDKASKSPRDVVLRRIPLWPETVRALQAAIQPAGVAMLTRRGKPLRYAEITPGGSVNLVDSISKLFRRAARDAGVETAGKGLSRLRHTLRSVAGGAGDESAADILAGHQLPGMRAVYQSVDDGRLRRVSDYVRHWLFTPTTE